jgi:hypothetical protein
MKLSNKILLGFFGFIFIYLTAAFTELRLTGSPNIIDDKNSKAETVDISGIAYLVLQDLDKDIRVIGSDRARLEVRSRSGDLLQNLEYNISGDTLTLSGLQIEDLRSVMISVFVPESGLKGITVNDATATVERLAVGHLYISQNAGRIWMSAVDIGELQIDALRKSFFQINGTNVDTLSAKIEESELFISAPVKLLKGSMQRNSSLQVIGIDEIQFKKDETSRLNMY